VGNPDVIELLVELGADPAARDAMGYTPLEHGRFMAERRRKEVLRKISLLKAVEEDGVFQLSENLLEAVLSGSVEVRA
jgi:hypothetical protein